MYNSIQIGKNRVETKWLKLTYVDYVILFPGHSLYVAQIWDKYESCGEGVWLNLCRM
jgi:hypothetical protein